MFMWPMVSGQNIDVNLSPDLLVNSKDSGGARPSPRSCLVCPHLLAIITRMQLICLQLKASRLQLNFFAYSCAWKIYLQLELFTENWNLLAYNRRSSSYSGKAHLST